MTFEEFQATRRYVDDLTEIDGWDGSGYVYADTCVIEDNGEDFAEGRWCLTIANYSEVSDDLDRFERELYDWCAGEMGWSDAS